MIKLFRGKLKRLFSDKQFSEILTGSIWSFAAKVAATGLTIISGIFVARVYGAEVKGTLSLIDAFVTLATMLTVLGTNTSILRLIPEYCKKYSIASAFKIYRKTQYLVLGVSLITSSLLYMGAGWIANTIFSKPYLAGFFALAAFFIIAKSIMDLNINAVRGLRLNRVFAFMQLLPELSRLVLLVLATYIIFNPVIPVYALFFSWLITALVGIIVMQVAFKRRVSQSDVVEDLPIKNILLISLPMLMTTSMSFFVAKTGVIMLGIFESEAQVGYYSVAVSLATLAAFTLQVINSMSASKYSELYHSGNIDELFHVARKSAKLIFWTSAPVLLCLVVFGSSIISLLYGESFSVAYPALLILTFGQFVNAVSGSTGMFLNMTGHQIALRNMMAGAVVINLLLNILLTPAYGMIGAATAGMVSMAFWNICALIFIRRKFGKTVGYLPIFWKTT
jgi:O-antigen/teichoic acid export membrane protein